MECEGLSVLTGTEVGHRGRLQWQCEVAGLGDLWRVSWVSVIVDSTDIYCSQSLFDITGGFGVYEFPVHVEYFLCNILILLVILVVVRTRVPLQDRRNPTCSSSSIYHC
jgi:hypothetical protein